MGGYERVSCFRFLYTQAGCVPGCRETNKLRVDRAVVGYDQFNDERCALVVGWPGWLTAWL